MNDRLTHRYLSEVDRIGETAFAVIMVVIINGYVALSELNTGFTYLVSVNLGACLLKSLKDDEVTWKRVEESLDGTFLSSFDGAGKRAIAKDVMNHVGNASLRESRMITRDEALGCLAIVSIYLVTGFILALPFLVFSNKILAWLISNTAGCAWLFWYGTQLGKKTGKHPLLIGFLMAAIGVGFLISAYIANAGL